MVLLSTRSTAGEKRAAAAHAMCDSGATLEEVGRMFGVSRERVRQIFRDHGLPVRCVKESYALQRARQSRQCASRIEDRFRQVRDVDAVAQELQLPKTLVAEIVEDAFTPAERRKPKNTRKKYTDDELIEFPAGGQCGPGRRAVGSELHRLCTGANNARWTSMADTSDACALRFGSWRAAVKAAGLAANPSSPIAGQTIFEDGHCIDALRAAARALGRAPTADEYEEFARSSNGALPSQATVRHRLGRWYQALERAGL